MPLNRSYVGKYNIYRQDNLDTCVLQGNRFSAPFDSATCVHLSTDQPLYGGTSALYPGLPAAAARPVKSAPPADSENSLVLFSLTISREADLSALDWPSAKRQAGRDV